MFVISKNLWELIITRREFVRKQKDNPAKQKALELDQKLKVMQESTDKLVLMTKSVENFTRMFRKL